MLGEDKAADIFNFGAETRGLSSIIYLRGFSVFIGGKKSGTEY